MQTKQLQASISCKHAAIGFPISTEELCFKLGQYERFWLQFISGAVAAEFNYFKVNRTGAFVLSLKYFFPSVFLFSSVVSFSLHVHCSFMQELSLPLSLSFSLVYFDGWHQRTSGSLCQISLLFPLILFTVRSLHSFSETAPTPHLLLINN